MIMLYLILRNDNIVMACGENYSIVTDDLNPNKTVHVVNGFKFDDGFRCEMAEMVKIPNDISSKLYKYENGEFIKVDLPKGKV